MNIEEYRKLENEINEECKLKIHKLRNEYIEKNKKFNIGDFVFNVTGIIKVERVSYKIFCDGIVYSGYRYKKNNDELSRTKDKKISSMWESNNLKLLRNN
jgi:hypothetical protein